MTPLTLHLRRYGRPGPVPLLLLHGLFGSSANWHRIAQHLAGQHHVLVPDLRNHGESPQDSDMTYPAMVEDLVALLAREGLQRVLMVGHSMGGKTAMWMTLSHPELVEAVAIVDIAPTVYPSGYEKIIDDLLALPMETIANRGDAEQRLAAAIPNSAVRGYILQNLRYGKQDWYWRANLPAIAASLPLLRAFPDPAGRQFTGPTLFLYGTKSDYIGAESLPSIRRLFPLARLRAIPNAGHWVYADQPDRFLAALRGFIDPFR
ncbi:MAG TPA: alpha/beta hydrolase [Chromatiaceae bacterium]|jgi:esterase|nr:MAG: hypothetical protein N838_07630 [Thiohalocapsa sp. PB-PSB1]QQO54130.1 MAG: alpha/beta fold hydrolase [Thiohalocapsa sp. PB-PSB1]HBG94251.1 alpha/beta hydrolase [Chromatiaceae bacterium]HCS92893.1 alpha/beta hydrolase [Chromatiaceae bacterium]